VRIEFPKSLNWALYHVHNRHHDGQVILCWKSVPDYAFSFHDEPPVLPAGRDFVCVGELIWRVEGDRFVHELMPLQHRSERELDERAERTKRHREYRQRLWERYNLEERLKDLNG